MKLVKQSQKHPSIRFIYTYLVIHYYRDLLPALLEQGWHVEVLISRAEYHTGAAFEFPPGIHVKYTPTIGFKPNSTLGKLMIMLFYMLFGVPYTLFGPRVDKTVFFTQPPVFSSWWAYVLKNLRRQKCYQIVQDIYPDIAIETGHIRRDSLLARSLTTLSQFALKRLDYLAVVGRCMEQKLISEGIDPEKITRIIQWANTDLAHPLLHDQNPFRKEHGWRDCFVLVYAGNIGIPQYFDDILEVCRRLKHKRPEFIFALIGNGVRIPQIQTHKDQHHLDNIVLIPFQPLANQSQFLSAGDAHFVSLRAGIEGLAVPSKAYSAMAVGRPIIYQGAPEGEIAQMLKEYPIGTVVPLHDPDTLEQAIIQYMDQPELARQQGKQSRETIEAKYNHHAANKHIIAWLQS